MEKLNSNLEDFLREITPYASRSHPFVAAFYDRYSFTELLKKSAYVDELKTLGMIKATNETDPVVCNVTMHGSVEFPDFFTLTSKGESYFAETEKQEKAASAKERRDRRWQIITILVSVVLSIVLSTVVSCATKSDAPVRVVLQNEVVENHGDSNNGTDADANHPQPEPVFVESESVQGKNTAGN